MVVNYEAVKESLIFTLPIAKTVVQVVDFMVVVPIRVMQEV